MRAIPWSQYYVLCSGFGDVSGLRAYIVCTTIVYTIAGQQELEQTRMNAFLRATM